MYLDCIIDNTKRINNDEYLCRNISIKQLINKEKKLIEHKGKIFFSDFNIKRLIKQSTFINQWNIYLSKWLYANEHHNVL